MECLHFYQQTDSMDGSWRFWNSSNSCFLEVDLDYSKELHQLHTGCSLAPNKIKIKEKVWLSYQ